MNITVYLGATPGNDPALEPAVRALGTWIGKNGHNLVYGGSKCGLMGMLAESVLEAGGKVTGVEPKFFVSSHASRASRPSSTTCRKWLNTWRIPMA